MLTACAEAWAPGCGSADWEQWPNLRERDTPRSRVPTVVRIGSITKGEEVRPILVPTLADGHLIIGDPELPVPLRSVSVAHLPISEQRAAKERAERVAALEYANRRHRLAEEGRTATDIARNLAVRTAAAMAPGSVRFTVWSRAGDQSFHDLQPEDQRGLVTIAQPGALSTLLERLAQRVVSTGPEQMGGFASLRELAETGSGLPRPWELVTLLGVGDRLRAADRDHLALILRDGPARGVSLIIHGLHLPEPPNNLHRISWNNRAKQWHTPANGDVLFDMDPPAPAAAAQAAGIAVIRTGAYTRRGTPANQKTPPARHYRQLVRYHAHAVTEADQTRVSFERGFPLTTPEALQETAKCVPAYLEQANTVTNTPARVAGLVHKAFGRHGTLRERAEAWALLQLVRNLPGTRGAMLTVLRRRYTALSTLPPNVTALAHTVGVTAHHGQHELPAGRQEYIAQFLPNEPPPWGFQLITDAALHPDKSVMPETPETRRALATHLEHTYGLHSLLDEEGQFLDRTFVAALAECELFFLYDFETATPALQNALTWRAQRRLERFDRERLPEGARRMYDLCMTRLQEIGRKENRREWAVRRLGELTTRQKTEAATEGDNLAAEPEPGGQ
jgi:hypothetical protein